MMDQYTQERTDLEFKRKQRTIDIQSMHDAIMDREKSYTEEELYKDLNWIEASGKIYEMNEGKKFEGNYQELAKYGIDKMSEFNYNMSGINITDPLDMRSHQTGMATELLKIHGADDDTKMAFAYLMDTYEKKDISLSGFGRAMKEIAVDPLTYIAPGSIIGKRIAMKSAEEVAMASLKEKLLGHLASPTAMAMAEGAAYTSADTSARQTVNIEAGLQKGYDPTSIATSAGLGAVAGGVITKGAEALGHQIGKGIDYITESAQEEMARMAGGGTPPSEYRGHHKAPTISGANTGDNLADIFPDDIYSNKAVQYYGTGDKQMDTKSIQIIQSMRNNPDKEVTIYRAVPKGVKDINDGDWITINPDYAKWHGESWVENGKYDIISKKVKASQISTNGDSIHEWGYNEGATK